VQLPDSNLVSDKEAKAKRWKEHFEQLLNYPPVPSPCRSAAVQRLKNGKAPGLCGITAEMLKASGVHGTQWLTNVIKQVWNSGVWSYHA